MEQMHHLKIVIHNLLLGIISAVVSLCLNWFLIAEVVVGVHPIVQFSAIALLLTGIGVGIRSLNFIVVVWLALAIGLYSSIFLSSPAYLRAYDLLGVRNILCWIAEFLVGYGMAYGFGNSFSRTTS